MRRSCNKISPVVVKKVCCSHMRLFAIGAILFCSIIFVAVTVQAASSGDLIKCSDFSSVYLLQDDGKRWVFPNEKTYFTWYSDFDSVVEVTCEELADYAIGGNITYKAGMRLLKLISVPTVYTVEDGGVLRAIQSEEQAVALFGDDWASEIDDLPDTFWGSYELGEPIDDDEVGVVSDDEEDVEIIEPELTYDGAYNGTLYATSEQIGNSTEIDDYMDNLDRNGVTWLLPFFTFEATPDESTLVVHEGLGYAVNAVQRYPGRIFPYYNPGWGGEEIEDEGLLGDELTDTYQDILEASIDIVGDDFFQGFGEIETQEWSVAHNSSEVLSIIDVAEDHSINAMFHPVASKISQVEDIAETYPDMTFLIHMYRSDLEDSLDDLIDILQSNDNLYFSIDAAHIAHYNGNDILYDAGSASAFNSQFDARYNSMLSDAINDYTELVEAAPDKVMWGTEAGPDYAFDDDVYDRLIKISRELIGAMDEDYQEGLAYKNALRVFGNGVTVDSDIAVYDSSDWDACEDADVDACDETCGTDEDSDLDSQAEVCFQACLFDLQCTDPLED